MPDITTTQVFVDGEKGITATKMNNIIANSVIQTDFIANKPSSATLDPTDQLLELKAGGTYARITGTQLANSVAAQYALANTSQAGMLHQTTGNIGDYCGGDNLFHVLNTYVSLTAATTLTNADINKFIICSGGSWTLTLPTAANGLAFRLRNDMGITGTTGTITVQPPAGLIDGAASLKLLPQQECQILCDGTNWRSFGLKREVILGTQDITSSTASAFVLLPTGYRFFELEFTGLLSVTDNVVLQGQFSSNGGSTWITAASYNYAINYTSGTAAIAALSTLNTTSLYLCSGVANTRPVSNCKVIIDPGVGVSYPTVNSFGSGWITGSYVRSFTVASHYGSATAMNAIQYFMSSGNIANSFLTVKGVV